MTHVGRQQERELILFGEYLLIACKRKAKRLGIQHYSWTRLAVDSGVDRAVITDAVSGVTKHPGIDKIWKLVASLEPGEELEKLICHSLGYSTKAEYEESQKSLHRMKSEG